MVNNQVVSRNQTNSISILPKIAESRNSHLGTVKTHSQLPSDNRVEKNIMSYISSPNNGLLPILKSPHVKGDTGGHAVRASMHHHHGYDSNHAFG